MILSETGIHPGSSPGQAFSGPCATDTAAFWSTARRCARAGIRRGHAAGTAGRARTRSPSARSGSPTNAAGAARCRDRISRCRVRSLFRMPAGFRAARIASKPRRRSARRAGGSRNRRRPPRLDRAAQADLAVERFPVKQEGGLRLRLQLAALPAAGIGVEDETLGVEALHQHHPEIRQAIGADGRKRHGVRVARLARDRLGHPGREQAQGLVGGREITSR